MGTESPVCARWIGTRFVDNFKRTYTVDAFGDNVGRAMMDGGGWTARHDAFKWTLTQQAAWAMYQVRVEPNNLFCHGSSRDGPPQAKFFQIFGFDREKIVF